MPPIAVGSVLEPVGSSDQVAPAQQDDGREPRPRVADISVEPLQRHPQPSPDRADRNSEDGGDLAVGSALQVGERDDLALLGAQLGHAAADGLPVQRRGQRLPVSSRRLASRHVVRKQSPRGAVISAAAAGIDAEYVMAAGQPRAHRVQPAVVAPRHFRGSIRPVLLESPHASTTVIPNPSKKTDESIAKSLHHA